MHGYSYGFLDVPHSCLLLILYFFSALYMLFVTNLHSSHCGLGTLVCLCATGHLNDLSKDRDSFISKRTMMFENAGKCLYVV